MTDESRRALQTLERMLAEVDEGERAKVHYWNMLAELRAEMAAMKAADYRP